MTPEDIDARATLGGGCFWCLEAVFQEVAGVVSVEPGYAGGDVPDPDYRSVCPGATGHAEVVQIAYRPEMVSFEELLEIFFAVHDPTTPDRQGADVGTQYRSIVLYHDEAQRESAERLIRRLEEERTFPDPIVTEIVPLRAFYPAEAYHRSYFRRNPDQIYCQVVISPKLARFRERFPNRRGMS
ncbi:MAG: peptide-methionine (S)-S-oxide reductase MsrA [Gemmatimonadota bacterium]